jgi:SAM-dependent methyltransferase
MLRVPCSGVPTLVHADPDRITQILTNIIGNALTATPPAGAVTITAQAADTQAEVTVTDTGVGLASEDLERVFERFYRARPARVLGIERSPTLALAAATGSPALPVVQADAARLPLANGCVSVAVASMSLLDIDSLEDAISETARVLCPGGVFCFAIVHPFDSASEGGTASAVPFVVSRPYLTSRRYEDRFERGGLGITIVSMHRPLSAYTTALFRAGLVITDLREHGEREIPWLLVIRAEKRS